MRTLRPDALKPNAAAGGEPAARNTGLHSEACRIKDRRPASGKPLSRRKRKAVRRAAAPAPQKNDRTGGQAADPVVLSQRIEESLPVSVPPSGGSKSVSGFKTGVEQIAERHQAVAKMNALDHNAGGQP